MATGRTDLLQGTLDLLILKTLALESMHGLGISRRIEQMTRGAFRVEPGSLFPALHRMEEQGLIAGEWARSENNRRARYYRLTREGSKRLTIERRNWKRIVAAMARVLETHS